MMKQRNKKGLKSRYILRMRHLNRLPWKTLKINDICFVNEVKGNHQNYPERLLIGKDCNLGEYPKKFEDSVKIKL